MLLRGNIYEQAEWMLLGVIFTCYVVALCLAVVMMGLNHLRIQTYLKANSNIVTLLVPLLLNFVLAKTVFHEIQPLLSTLIPGLIMFFLGKEINKVRILGLTGGISCGKSTIGKLLKDGLSLSIIDCDCITKELSVKGQKGYSLIMELLGDNHHQFLTSNGEINRDLLSAYVFDHAQMRKTLTKRMGRLIFFKIVQQILLNVRHKRYDMLLDAPLLFQTKILQYFCFPIIVIGCKETVQIERLMARDNYTKDEAISRIQSQMPLYKKQKLADVFVLNDRTPEEAFAEIVGKLERFLK